MIKLSMRWSTRRRLYRISIRFVPLAQSGVTLAAYNSRSVKSIPDSDPDRTNRGKMSSPKGYTEYDVPNQPSLQQIIVELERNRNT